MKLIEPRKVAVGENTFYIRPLPAFRAANLTAELASLVMPMLSGLAPLLDSVGTKENEGLMDVNIEDAAPAVAGAFSSISGDKVEAILHHLLVTGGNIAYDDPDTGKALTLTEESANELFCQDVQDMFLLAFEVIRTNYNGFFKKLADRSGNLVAALKAKAATVQSATAAST